MHLSCTPCQNMARSVLAVLHLILSQFPLLVTKVGINSGPHFLGGLDMQETHLVPRTEPHPQSPTLLHLHCPRQRASLVAGPRAPQRWLSCCGPWYRVGPLLMLRERLGWLLWIWRRNQSERVKPHSRWSKVTQHTLSFSSRVQLSQVS